MKNLFSPNDLMVLRNTIGQKVNFFTGSNMSEFLDAEKIAISAGATNVLFSTRLVESDFQGFDEDYCHIDVHEASNATMNELEKQSGIFIQPRDAVIQKISVQEETIRFFEYGHNKWSYTAHTGVLFELDEGYLYVFALTYHAEIIRIQYSKTFSDLDMSPTIGNFDEAIGEHFEISRSFIPLEVK